MSSLQANPMHEFIEFNGHEKVHEIFEQFLLKFPRRYANTLEREEHNKRRDIFRQNLRYSSLTNTKAFHHLLLLIITAELRMRRKRARARSLIAKKNYTGNPSMQENLVL